MEEKIYRIGIDARLFGTAQAAGIGQYAEELIRHLLKNDTVNQYRVFLSPKSWVGFPIYAPNLNKIRVNMPHYSLSEQLSYPAILQKADLDLVHYTNFNSPIWWRKVPSVVTIHDLTLWFFAGRTHKSWWRRWAYRIAIRQACRNARRIIAITEATKQDVVNILQVDPTKVTVIYEAVADRYRPATDAHRLERLRHKFNISKPYLLYVGQWRQHKNVVRLIRAFHLLRRRYYLDYQLVLAGKIDYQCPEVLSTIAKLGLKSEVVLTGYIPDADLPLLYNGAELFVFPSLYEGFGLPPLEAMACGTPVVAACASCIPEVLGEAARYFNPTNVEDMVKTIAEVVKSQSLRQRLRAAGFRRVRRYSFDQMAKQTLEVYQQVLNGL
ncbi:MAG: glycosyltransferase family 1 protein [Patescibacteria group bacterium]